MSAATSVPCPLCDVDGMASKVEAYLFGVLVGNVHTAEVAAERVCSKHREEIVPGYMGVIRTIADAAEEAPAVEVGS